jgi:cell division protein FtsB
VSVARFLPPVLAAATLLLLGANAIPAAQRKHALQRERLRLDAQLREAEAENLRLRAELAALREDPFVLERYACEAWRRLPPGTVRFEEAFAPTPPPPPP